jgi:hypothetical protein
MWEISSERSGVAFARCFRQRDQRGAVINGRYIKQCRCWQIEKIATIKS